MEDKILKKNILISMLLSALIVITSCNNSSDSRETDMHDSEEITTEATADSLNQEETKQLSNGDNKIMSEYIFLISNFNRSGHFNETIVNYFEDTDTFVIIPIFSNADSFDNEYLLGNWKDSITKYKNMILSSIDKTLETFPNSKYIVSFSTGNDEMSIPALVFDYDNLIFDNYSTSTTPEIKALYMLKNYFWQHPVNNIENAEIDYEFDTNTYEICLYGSDFNKNTITASKMDNVSAAAKNLSTNILKLISYYNDTASIKLKILDGENTDTNLLVIANNEIIFNYLNNDEISIKAGTYLVGKDIPAGEYALLCDNDHVGSFFVSSDLNDDSAIYTTAFFGNSFVTVENGQYLTIEDVTAIPAENAEIDISSQGTFRVGVDIPAGEYELEKLIESEYFSEKAFFKVYADDIATSMKIILSDDFEEGNAYVTVNDGEYLKLDRCKIVK